MIESKIKIGGYFEVECFDALGKLKWKDKAKNMWVMEGRDYLLTNIFKGGTPSDPLYIGLWKTEAAVEDTWAMANNGSTWHEDGTYDEVARQEFVDGAIGGTTTRTVDNDASKAVFTMSGTVTLKGAFLSTNDTKLGTTGSLLCAAAFTEGDRAVVDNDVVNVKYTVGCADDAV